MYMRYSLAIFLFFAASVSLQAQSPYTIDWSEMEQSRGKLIYTMPNDSGAFYSLRWSGGRVAGSYQVSKHVDFKVVETGKIKLVVNRSYANFEGAKVINGKFAIFLSDKSDGGNHLYIQHYDEQLKPEGEAILLASYDLNTSTGKGAFNVILSENEKYIGIVWEIEGRRENNAVYGFKVYDLDFNVVNDGEYPLPFKPELSTIHSHYISNQGDYFLVISEYEESENKNIFKSYLNYKAVHIFHITDDGLQDFTLDLGGKRVEEMVVTSDDKQVFTITGMYGEDNVAGISGVFHQQIDYRSGVVLQEGFKQFDDAFIMENWSERAMRRTERLEEKGKPHQPKLFNYKMRNARLLRDGSIVGTMEQNYVQLMSNSDIRTGQTNDVYYYYYNDIIVYKINSNGEFDWVKRVNKYQISTNDDGPYSSYVSFIDDVHISFIFNDNTDNYDQAGRLIENQGMYTANFGRRRNVVAMATINIETGDRSQFTLFDRSEIDALAVPKLFNVDYNRREVLMYAIWGRNERFGRIKF